MKTFCTNRKSLTFDLDLVVKVAQRPTPSQNFQRLQIFAILVSFLWGNLKRKWKHFVQTEKVLTFLLGLWPWPFDLWPWPCSKSSSKANTKVITQQNCLNISYILFSQSFLVLMYNVLIFVTISFLFKGVCIKYGRGGLNIYRFTDLVIPLKRFCALPIGLKATNTPLWSSFVAFSVPWKWKWNEKFVTPPIKGILNLVIPP